MNIKNRLAKIEDSLNVNSEVCFCNGEGLKTEVRHEREPYDAYSTGEYVPYQNSEQARQRALQDEAEKSELVERCNDCKKPVNKQIITVCFVGVAPERALHTDDAKASQAIKAARLLSGLNSGESLQPSVN